LFSFETIRAPHGNIRFEHKTCPSLLKNK